MGYRLSNGPELKYLLTHFLPLYPLTKTPLSLGFSLNHKLLSS